MLLIRVFRFSLAGQVSLLVKEMEYNTNCVLQVVVVTASTGGHLCLGQVYHVCQEDTLIVHRLLHCLGGDCK